MGMVHHRWIATLTWDGVTGQMKDRIVLTGQLVTGNRGTGHLDLMQTTPQTVSMITSSTFK